jgi:hypothetical protein
MAKNERILNGILGDIRPTPPSRPDTRGRSREQIAGHEHDEAMHGGSRHDDNSEHSGSRDVTEGVSGGLGTEVGGSRNYRQGTGASGSDIGNRPE